MQAPSDSNSRDEVPFWASEDWRFFKWGRTGFALDVLGYDYDPDNAKANKRIVIDARQRPDRGYLMGGRNDFRDLYDDYHLEDKDGADTYTLMESLIGKNLPGDTYYQLVRAVCARMGESSQAGQAAQALKLELRLSYGPAGRKLRAIRVWGMLLRYCSSKALVAKTTATTFLRPVRKICQDAKGHVGLQRRILEVIAGATLIYPECAAFKALWKSVKGPADPVEGIPFRNPLFVLPNIPSRTVSTVLSEEAGAQPCREVEPPEAAGALAMPRGPSPADRGDAPENLDHLPQMTIADAPQRMSMVTVMSAAGTLPAYTEVVDMWSVAPPDYE